MLPHTITPYPFSPFVPISHSKKLTFLFLISHSQERNRTLVACFGGFSAFGLLYKIATFEKKTSFRLVN